RLFCSSSWACRYSVGLANPGDAGSGRLSDLAFAIIRVRHAQPACANPASSLLAPCRSAGPPLQTGKGIQPKRRSLGQSKPERNWEKPLIIGRFAGVCLFAPLFQGLDTGLQGFDALERTGQQIGLDVEFFPGDQVHAGKCLGHEGLHVALDIGRRGLGQQFGHVLLEIIEQLIGGDHRCLLGWARKTIILPAPAGRSGTASRTYAAPPGRYWIAWPTCPASTRSAPSRSASVRATRRVRRVARADQPQADAARASNARISPSG